jgi:hypothetical protein
MSVDSNARRTKTWAMHLPGVTYPTVHLDRRLANGAGGARAIRLGRRCSGEGVDGPQRVRGPGRVQGDAARALGRDERVRQQVLHRLERPDRHSVLRTVLRVGGAQLNGAAHRADEIGARERQPERGPTDNVIARQGADHGAVLTDRRRRPGEVHRWQRIAERHLEHDPLSRRQRRDRAPSIDSDRATQRTQVHPQCNRFPRRRRSGPGQPAELSGQRRPEERRVGDSTSELLGDDRGLDPGTPGDAGVAPRAQLPPS